MTVDHGASLLGNWDVVDIIFCLSKPTRHSQRKSLIDWYKLDCFKGYVPCTKIEQSQTVCVGLAITLLHQECCWKRNTVEKHQLPTTLRHNGWDKEYRGKLELQKSKPDSQSLPWIVLENHITPEALNDRLLKSSGETHEEKGVLYRWPSDFVNEGLMCDDEEKICQGSFSIQYLEVSYHRG